MIVEGGGDKGITRVAPVGLGDEEAVVFLGGVGVAKVVFHDGRRTGL